MDFIASPVRQWEILFLRGAAGELGGKVHEEVGDEMHDCALALDAALHAEHSCCGVTRRSRVAQLGTSIYLAGIGGS
jgi:hypothetical protein